MTFSLGHQFLCQQGILHRDISPGNILLAGDAAAEPGGQGFIADLEYAQVGNDVLKLEPHLLSAGKPAGLPETSCATRPESAKRSKSSSNPVLRGAEISVSDTAMILEPFLTRYRPGDHSVRVG